MLSIIIVNYKNEEKTILYVKEELIKIKIPYVIIIVNNSATEKSNQILSKELNAEIISDINLVPIFSIQCYIISHTDNLGFAKGNNLGTEFAIKHFDITHILFTNNDIRFLNSHVVELLISKLDSLNEEIALIGPKVLGLNGQNQSPEPYYPFWNRYIWMYWLTPFLSTNMKRKLFKLDYPEKAKEGIHYKVMGSFFIVKKSDFLRCGMMDANTFLFGEEIILSERLNKIGKKVYYFPEVAILHEHGLTISKHLDAKKMLFTQFYNECYYYETYRKISKLSIQIGKLSVYIYSIILPKNKTPS